MARSRRSRRTSRWAELRLRVERQLPPDRRTVGLGLAFVAVVAFGWFGIQAVQARSALNDAASFAELLQDQVVAGDTDAAQVTLRSLQQASSDARGSTDGFLWSIGSKVPLLGRNVGAVQTVAAEFDRVSRDAIPPIVDLSGRLNARAFTPSDGEIDVDAFDEVGPGIATAAASLDESRDALAEIDVDSLLVPLRASVATVKQRIGTAAEAAENADLAARVLPELLGQDGRRRFMLLVQNNAEVRPLGGIVGSFSIIETRNGRITMREQGTARSFADVDGSVVDLRDDELAVFPSTMARDLRNTVITPEFTRTAEIAAGLFEEQFDKRIDGVVSVDPVALSYLLSGLGAVTLEDEVVIDANNVVSALLHQVYVLLPDAGAQDIFFEDVTRAVFDRFTEGSGDQTAALRGLVRGVEENRVTFWSASEQIQELVAPTELSGVYGDDVDSPRVGVFLSDAAAGKMEYFLNHSSSIRAENCLDDDQQVIGVTTQLTSTAPTEGLPLFVTGTGTLVERGSMRLNVRLVSPTGGRFTSVRVDGQPVTVLSDRWTDRNVTRVEIVLRPGESRTISANVTSGPDQAGKPIFTTTPGVASVRNDFMVPSACS